MMWICLYIRIHLVDYYCSWEGRVKAFSCSFLCSLSIDLRAGIEVIRGGSRGRRGVRRIASMVV